MKPKNWKAFVFLKKITEQVIDRAEVCYSRHKRLFNLNKVFKIQLCLHHCSLAFSLLSPYLC